MTNQKLVSFIQKARKRGFLDSQIIPPLLKKGWPIEEIEDAIISFYPKSKLKNQVCIFLGDDVLTLLEKRAKKNMFNLSEQIEDILRRSCALKTSKSSSKPEKEIDDLLVRCFSRKNTGRKKKN
jgi:hypothetical protein